MLVDKKVIDVAWITREIKISKHIRDSNISIAISEFLVTWETLDMKKFRRNKIWQQKDK